MSESNSGTSTGIQPNLAGWLCYLGWWITGLIFFVTEKKNKFVRSHALQSTIVFGLFSILLVISMVLFLFIPIFKVVFYVFGALSFVLWIIFMILAAQGKMIKLPWIGNLVGKYINSDPSQPAQTQPPTPQSQ